MSNCWLTVIPPDSAAGRLKKIYKRVQSPNGQVDQVYQAQSLRPETISGHDHLYKSVLHFENPACPPWFLEAVAVYTSVLNHCPYAVTHHAANLKHLLGNPGRAAVILDAFQSNSLSAAFAGKELSLLNYAQKLTLSPGDLRDADVAQLKKQGAREEEILEVNQVVACFNYANRVINGLGVQLGDEQIGYYYSSG
jgi:uncharacterized peroxidase-related enzyme